ncbi:MAG: hypothetical protein HYT03_01955 [Candidatus Harrisonbacteria bacterium]|nr:hypothetical protein [Candidatus Harrisonbacteria bacterium]
MKSFVLTTSLVLLLALPVAQLAQASGLSTLYNLTGTQNDELFGYPIGFIGDVNNDTYEDFAVGSLGYDTAYTDSGRVQIYSGQTGSVIRQHTQPVDPEGITNPNNAWFGSALAGIGDVNGDGNDDYAILDPRYSTGLLSAGGTTLNELGRVIAYSGADGSELWSYIGTVPFQFKFGNSLMMLTSDRNSDGKRDIAVGAPAMGVSAQNAGAILILDSTNGNLITQYDGTREDESVGSRFSTGFDINGDTVEDFVIGDSFYTNIQFAQGRVIVLSGSDFSTIYTQDTTTPERFGAFGVSVGFVDDVNNDSTVDFAASSRETVAGQPRAGSIRVFSGATNTLLTQYSGTSRYQLFGNSITVLGDINNDGYNDIASLSVMENGQGRANVVNSKLQLFWDQIAAGAGESGGADADGRGIDINKDGRPDFIFGAPGAKVGADERGRARVVISDHTHVQTGSNIEVYPVLGDISFKLVFSSVTGAGNVGYSYLGQTSTGATFRTRQGAKEEGWNITTTATRSGATSICLKWDTAVGYNESQLQLQHFEGGSWIQISTSSDLVNKIICGSTSQSL